MTLDYEVYKEGGILNNRYQKIEDISEGSYGYVSLAKDVQQKKLVAIKYIFKLDDDENDDGEDKKEDTQDTDSRPNDVGNEKLGGTSSQEKKTQLKRLKSKISSNVKSRLSGNICFEAIYEIDIQTKIGNDHKNIVKLLDFFDSYIVLEYCSGGDLYEAIKNDLVPRKTKQISHIFYQIIDAIQFIHSKQIYHRDLKPENILISNLFDWTIKISDFGLATTEPKSMDRNVGSERYMAPELFESNLDLEERKDPYHCDKVDVWSIGIVFLNIVFSKNPFSVANQSDKSFCYFAANREALFDVFSTMSLDFFQVLRYSLTIDPTNRDLEKMKLELMNLSEYTLDDEYYNRLEDDEIAISDDEIQPIPSYIPPSSAPMPVSLPTPISSAAEKPKKTHHLNHLVTPDDSTATSNDVSNQSSLTSTTPISASSTPEEKQRARSVPKFKFQKRSHLPKANNNITYNSYNNYNLTSNNYNNNHNIGNNNMSKTFGKSAKNLNYNNNNNHNNNANNFYSNNRHYNVNSSNIIKHSRKPLGIPTPNTHINNFFHDYHQNKEANNTSNNFNTRDFFTPPSVHNKYMEGIFSHDQNYNYNHSRSNKLGGSGKYHSISTNNKSFNSIASNGKHRKSFNNGNNNNKLSVPKSKALPNTMPLQHSPGKYIPPNARNHYGSQPYPDASHVPDISAVLNGTTTFHEQYTNMDTNTNGGGVDLDDVLFTLEENEHDFIHDINNLSLSESPAPISKTGPIAVTSPKNDLPDLLKSPAPKEQHLFASSNPFADQLLRPDGNTNQNELNNKQNRRPSSENKYKSGVYIPPHHRKNSSLSPSNANEATLSVTNNSLNYSTSFNSKPSSANVEPSRSYQRSFLVPLINHSTTTTALQDNDIFAQTNNDALFFSDDDSDIANSPDVRSMFGPYEIYNNNSNVLNQFRGGRKSSTLQDEAVGSLEQYKNNWLMLQQQQD